MEVRTGTLLKGLWTASLIFLALWFLSALRPRELPPGASVYFSEEMLERSLSRARLAYVNSGLGTLASFSALYLIGRWSTRSSILAGAIRGPVTPGRAALLGLGLGAGAALLFALVGLPFGIYAYYLDRSFHLTPMALSTYLVDYGKNAVLSGLEYSAAGAFAAWAIVRLPHAWHLLLGAAFLIASLAVYALYPVVIAPMFNSFHPLPEGPVLQDVRELASSAGMEVDRVLVMEASAKTSRANAYFAGIGRTKQVVLYDTLLDSHSREEVRLVVAHELAHWRSGHLVKTAFLSFAAAMAALLLFSLSWSQTHPASALEIERFLVTLFVFAILAGFVVSPASSYVSRRFEMQSDAYALTLTGDNQAFIQSQVNLATTNLADVQPPRFMRWFAATHPSTLERILSASR